MRLGPEDKFFEVTGNDGLHDGSSMDSKGAIWNAGCRGG